jgi:hypothetical protein
MVAVVVVAELAAAVSENDGSTKSAGDCDSPPPVMNTTAATRTPMTAMPAALAPTTARVELCQGSSDGSSPPNSSSNSASSDSSSRAGPVTATDISPPTCGNAC